MNLIQNKVALITGGTKGIGYGIAESLMKEGVHVAITSRSGSSAEEAANQLNSNSKTGAKAIGIEADVKNFESQQLALDG